MVLTLPAPTLMGVMNALARMGTLEMERNAYVRKSGDWVGMQCCIRISMNIT